MILYGLYRKLVPLLHNQSNHQEKCLISQIKEEAEGTADLRWSNIEVIQAIEQEKEIT